MKENLPESQPVTDLLQVDADAFERLCDVGVHPCGHEPEVVLHVDPDHEAAIFTHPATRNHGTLHV